MPEALANVGLLRVDLRLPLFQPEMLQHFY
jgi:hypothetical protein